MSDVRIVVATHDEREIEISIPVLVTSTNSDLNEAALLAAVDEAASRTKAAIRGAS